MDLWSAIFLGLVQGLTEFLPVSSSGHLVVAQHLLGIHAPGVGLELALHIGTLAAVALVFHVELGKLCRVAVRPSRWRTSDDGRRLWGLIGATLATGLVALVLKSRVEAAFDNLAAVGIGFLATALVLTLTTLVRPRGAHLIGARAVWVGLVQGLATWPGLSRSGSTIAAALLSGADREDAARFSFLLAVPTIMLASAAEVGSHGLSHIAALPLLVGMASSAVSGTVALRWLMDVVRQGKLWWFSIYVVTLGGLVLLGIV